MSGRAAGGNHMTDIRDSKNWSFETRQLHIGQEQADPATDSRLSRSTRPHPMYSIIAACGRPFRYPGRRQHLRKAYQQHGRRIRKRIASLEGGTAALVTASGAAAINYTISALARSGEHIVASKPFMAAPMICWRIPSLLLQTSLQLLSIRNRKDLLKRLFRIIQRRFSWKRSATRNSECHRYRSSRRGRP